LKYIVIEPVHFILFFIFFHIICPFFPERMSVFLQGKNKILLHWTVLFITWNTLTRAHHISLGQKVNNIIIIYFCIILSYVWPWREKCSLLDTVIAKMQIIFSSWVNIFVFIVTKHINITGLWIKIFFLSIFSRWKMSLLKATVL